MHSTRGNESGDFADPGGGILYLVATPIGNLGDITLRALDVLRSVDLIAAEDTRHTRKLLSHFDIHKPLLSYHSHNLTQRGPAIIARLANGARVALVTDAGTPGISDPGALLTRQAIEANRRVEAIPGPTALITGLILSGLPTHPFAFLGFPPARGPGRQRFFADHSELRMTCVLYESAPRLQRTLSDLLAAWGDRSVVVARELTKRYETVYRGTLSEASIAFAGEVRGELTLVVAGAPRGTGRADAEAAWKELLREKMLDGGLRLRDAVDQVCVEFGVSRRVVYETALRILGKGS
jgi:16S rRNA (cytidine1402-2'-O)-methyltransferase